MGDTEKAGKSRRDFLNWVLGLGFVGWITAIIYPVFKYIVPPKSNEPNVQSILVGKEKDFKIFSGTIFKFGNKPGILIRLKNGDFRAFSAVCTHLSCTVQFREDFKSIWCACHNGKYDLNGKNISGPPPRPLEQYQVIVKAGEVFVKKGEV